VTGGNASYDPATGNITVTVNDPAPNGLLTLKYLVGDGRTAALGQVQIKLSLAKPVELAALSDAPQAADAGTAAARQTVNVTPSVLATSGNAGARLTDTMRLQAQFAGLGPMPSAAAEVDAHTSPVFGEHPSASHLADALFASGLVITARRPKQQGSQKPRPVMTFDLRQGEFSSWNGEEELFEISDISAEDSDPSWIVIERPEV
jgi:hypothetical protein